uniref:Coiled-coil domain-containing protein 187 n=1 Tax=Catagonus wagneri TaxID=51154 RepID=A0A8C3X636_9CETA
MGRACSVPLLALSPWQLGRGRPPVCLGEMTQARKDSRRQGPPPLGPQGARLAGGAVKDRRCPPATEDDVMSALRWPPPSREAGALRGPTRVAWSDHLEEPGPQGKARHLLVWSADEGAKDGDGSVSSGRLSGSSGGHESGTAPRGPWKERTPQVLGPPRPPREGGPRLEQLRDKIRAQARWQASCASLGTSMPSSASQLCKAPTPAPRRKARRPASPPPASALPGQRQLSPERDGRGWGESGAGMGPRQPAVLVPREKPKRMKSSSCKKEKAPKPTTLRRTAKDTDSELVGVYAWRKGRALVRALLGPPPDLPRLQSKVPSGARAPAAQLGHSKKARAGESGPVRAQVPSLASVCSDPQASASAPHAASCDQSRNIQAAMAILRDLRQQIQTGLELARDGHSRRGLELRDLAGKRRPGPRSPPDERGSFWKSPRNRTEGVPASPERAGSLATAPRWSSSARWDSCPQRARAAQGPDPSLQRPGSLPEGLGPFLQRPWSALAGQASGPQGAWTACGDAEAPAQGPRSPLERSGPPRWRPWSASFLQGPSPACGDTGSPPSSSGTKLAWLRHSQGALWNEVRPPPPCPKPRGLLGPPCSPKSLRWRAGAWRQQALEKKAPAVCARELRTQRLQDTYPKRKETVLSKAIPVVSQTTPGIVTFVPHSAQSRGPEAPGSPGAPVLEWSKVTSGVVLGDQEAPGSFCLCLNRASNPAKMLATGGPQDGWEGAPLLMSASSSPGPLRLQDLAAPGPRPGLCVYLDPEESERLGLPGPLHFSCKQARLQALETTASILKQRIDTLTDKLHRSEAIDTLEDPGLDVPSWSSGPPACPGALVPSVGPGLPGDWTGVQARPLLSPRCFPDGETLPWSPGWEPQWSGSPRCRHAGQPRGRAGELLLVSI